VLSKFYSVEFCGCKLGNIHLRSTVRLKPSAGNPAQATQHKQPSTGNPAQASRALEMDASYLVQ